MPATPHNRHPVHFSIPITPSRYNHALVLPIFIPSIVCPTSIMAEVKLDILKDAIARNAAAVISLPIDGVLRPYKSRFLAVDGDGFWVEADPNSHAVLDDLAARQVRVGVAFRTTLYKGIFTAPILRREPLYPVNRELTVDALLLRLPEQIAAVQRRSNYRVALPADHELVARVWKIPDHWVLRDRPPAVMEIAASVRDLSASGIGLLVAPNQGQPVPLHPNTRLRIQIQYGDAEFLIEGRARHSVATPNASQRVGVQFSKLENSIEGRQTLDKLTAIVGRLRREEARRLRLGRAA